MAAMVPARRRPTVRPCWVFELLLVGWLVLGVMSVARAQPAPAEPPPPARTAAPDAAPPPASSDASPAGKAPAYRPVTALRDSPRNTVSGFLRSTGEGELAEAVHYLDLRGMRWGQLTPERAADQLAQVMAKRLVIRLDAISDLPEGRPEDGEGTERIGTIEADGESVPITLTRIPSPGGKPVWLFSQETVARIPDLYRAHTEAESFIENIPASLRVPSVYGLMRWQWIGIALSVAVAYPIGYLLGSLVVWGLRRLTARTRFRWDDAIVDRGRGPFRFAFGWIVLGMVVVRLDLPASFLDRYRVLYATPLILATGWFLIRAVSAVTQVLAMPDPEDGGEDLRYRSLRTQLVMLRKIANIVIGFVTFSIVLLQFQVVQSVGVSLLASAGVAGIALGFAAQRSLGAVIAGIQMSIAQPIRIGDDVVVEGQFGTVEEIALTFVRLKLWDERRLIVPVDVFLTKAFENWSKPGDELIGVVELAVDPSTPLAKLRAEIKALVESHDSHDGRVCSIQLTDVGEQRALLRILASTNRPTEAFAMRCDIREGALAFLQAWEGGRYLVHQRLELSGVERPPPV